MVDLGFNGDDMIIFALLNHSNCSVGNRLKEDRMGERKLLKGCYNSSGRHYHGLELMAVKRNEKKG